MKLFNKTTAAVAIQLLLLCGWEAAASRFAVAAEAAPTLANSGKALAEKYFVIPHAAALGLTARRVATAIIKGAPDISAWNGFLAAMGVSLPGVSANSEVKLNDITTAAQNFRAQIAVAMAAGFTPSSIARLLADEFSNAGFSNKSSAEGFAINITTILNARLPVTTTSDNREEIAALDLARLNIRAYQLLYALDQRYNAHKDPAYVALIQADRLWIDKANQTIAAVCVFLLNEQRPSNGATDLAGFIGMVTDGDQLQGYWNNALKNYLSKNRLQEREELARELKNQLAELRRALIDKFNKIPVSQNRIARLDPDATDQARFFLQLFHTLVATAWNLSPDLAQQSFDLLRQDISSAFMGKPQAHSAALGLIDEMCDHLATGYPTQITPLFGILHAALNESPPSEVNLAYLIQHQQPPLPLAPWLQRHRAMIAALPEEERGLAVQQILTILHDELQRQAANTKGRAILPTARASLPGIPPALLEAAAASLKGEKDPPALPRGWKKIELSPLERLLPGL